MTLETVGTILGAGVAIVLFFFALAVNALVGWVWLQALLSGVYVPAVEILRMRLRRTDANAVIKALITAKQGGIDIPCREMERAYLQGVDLRKVSLAAIEANRQGIEITFQELVDADLADQLEEKLGRKHREPSYCESF
jgi:uncharacterized protein YqfA (UPF0365 family)